MSWHGFQEVHASCTRNLRPMEPPGCQLHDNSQSWVDGDMSMLLRFLHYPGIDDCGCLTHHHSNEPFHNQFLIKTLTHQAEAADQFRPTVYTGKNGRLLSRSIWA